MMGDLDLPGPEKRSQTRVVPQAEAQPSPQDDAIPAAGDVPQSQTGTAGLSDARSPFDFRRLRRGDLIAAIGSFLVFIFLFLPWYGFAAAAAQVSDSVTPAQQELVLAICSDQPAVCNSDTPPQFSVSALGSGAGGWRFLILVAAIIAVLYVLSRTLERVARAVPYHWQILVGITALQALLVLIAFIANPLSILDSLGSSSWEAGAILALIAAIGAVVGAVLVMQEDKKQRAVSPASGYGLRLR
jgi:hypothetical protein